MTFRSIRYETRGAVALITLARPERLNAMDSSMLGEMNEATDRAEADPDVRAIVLAAEGRAFCAGFDLTAELAQPPAGVEGWRPILEHDYATILRFWDSEKPTLAAVQGFCVAGGCELALACDITIAAENAVFGEPELRFGAGIVVMLVPWFLGPKQAKEILFALSERISAERALALGLINRVVPVGQEIEATLEVARVLAALDPAALKATKRAINRSYEIMGLKTALRMALDEDTMLEGQSTDLRREFSAVLKRDGLKAALAWREARIEKARKGEP
jgi:enoyl-CoA hydratase/carnithine racemase